MGKGKAEEPKKALTLEESMVAYKPIFRGSFAGQLAVRNRGPIREVSVFIPTREKRDPNKWVPESKLKKGGFRRTCFQQGTVEWLWDGESWGLHRLT